ncbi:hypothetical protein, partial [Candidatus Thiosymbion oneisti]|uniref:hypothetical protein n=2 Tax=Candidatus Thiosymbion oneisti TaxID=589554 RepID=UPI0013FD6F40
TGVILPAASPLGSNFARCPVTGVAPARDCDPEKIGLFGFISCGEELKSDLQKLRQERDVERQRQETLRKDRSRLAARVSRLQEKTTHLRLRYEELKLRQADVERNISEYLAAVDRIGDTVLANRQETERLSQNLIAYAEQLESFATAADDVSFDDFSAIRSAVSLATNYQDYRELKRNVHKARSSGRTFRKVAMEIGTKAGFAVLARLNPAIGLVTTAYKIGKSALLGIAKLFGFR